MIGRGGGASNGGAVGGGWHSRRPRFAKLGLWPQAGSWRALHEQSWTFELVRGPCRARAELAQSLFVYEVLHERKTGFTYWSGMLRRGRVLNGTYREPRRGVCDGTCGDERRRSTARGSARRQSPGGWAGGGRGGETRFGGGTYQHTYHQHRCDQHHPSDRRYRRPEGDDLRAEQAWGEALGVKEPRNVP